jgi:hypothetical protein
LFASQTIILVDERNPKMCAAFFSASAVKSTLKFVPSVKPGAIVPLEESLNKIALAEHLAGL